MSYRCDLFFIFRLTFIAVNHTTSLKQMYFFLLIFKNISYHFWMRTWMKKANNLQPGKVQPQGIA